MDDWNAERAIAGVIAKTDYEGRILVINIRDTIDYMTAQYRLY